MPECVILIGLPAAGKTTFYRERFASTHAHVSKDLYPSSRDKEARQQRELESALSAGRSVVVDNTNPTAAARAPVIAIARQHAARVVGYFFDLAPRVAVARNEERSGRAKVPKVAIFVTARKLEPPSPEEGFDELYVVRPGRNGAIDISPWSPSRKTRTTRPSLTRRE